MKFQLSLEKLTNLDKKKRFLKMKINALEIGKKDGLCSGVFCWFLLCEFVGATISFTENLAENVDSDHVYLYFLAFSLLLTQWLKTVEYTSRIGFVGRASYNLMQLFWTIYIVCVVSNQKIFWQIWIWNTNLKCAFYFLMLTLGSR